MADEVPVNRTDLLILAVVSLLGGIVLASLLLSPALSPPYFSAILASTMLVAFFLFIPAMGVRLFIDDWGDEDADRR